jgi:hypothetical protein
MKQIGTCRTCEHWDQKYPQNTELGACTVMGVFLWANQDDELGDAAITTGKWGHKPSSDVQDVRTSADFGCIEWEAKR